MVSSSSSSPLGNFQLCIVDEQDDDSCILSSISSNTTVGAPSLIDMYDPNDIGKVTFKIMETQSMFHVKFLMDYGLDLNGLYRIKLYI